MSANLSGFYSCIAENEVGKDFRHYEVTVTGNFALFYSNFYSQISLENVY